MPVIDVGVLGNGTVAFWSTIYSYPKEPDTPVQLRFAEVDKMPVACGFEGLGQGGPAGTNVIEPKNL